MAGLDYFFDEQLRRYRLQITRIFHGFQYKTITRDGIEVLRQVPVQWGSADRVVQHIMRNNSENVMNSIPMICVSEPGIEMAPERRQNPTHVETLQIAERAYDEETGTYTSDPGNRYSMQRYMPVPINLMPRVDIVWSNQYQCDQLLEQILVVFNPALDFQTSTNALDWSSISTLEMTGIETATKQIPVGTENPIGVTTLNFKAWAWINPPAKLYKQKIISQIITNILEDHPCFAKGTGVEYHDEDLLGRVMVNFGNMRVAINGNEIWLLDANGCRFDEDGVPYSWRYYIEKQGTLRPDQSLFALRKYDAHPDDNSKTIYGTVNYHPTNQNVLLWTVNPLTLPGNSMDPINAIIDPHEVFPGGGLPLPNIGQRYILLSEIGGQDANNISGATVAWGSLTAQKDSVIMFNGVAWTVAMDPQTTSSQQFALNQFTSKQLRWTGKEWEMAIDGEYPVGIWRLYL